VLEPYAGVLKGHRAYVVATPGLQRRLERAPLGLTIDPELRFDPLRRASADFLGRVERLDGLAYSARGLAMPRWAFYDCAELPGVIFGLAVAAGDLAPAARSALAVARDDEAYVPTSIFLAVPMLEAGHWLGYGLCDLHEVSPGASHPGLRLLTLALALDLLAARRLTGTMQWSSPRLHAWARFAPLGVRAAWVPAHSEPATCAFRFDVTPGRLARALQPAPIECPPEAELVDVGDPAVLLGLQRAIESGREVAIVGAPAERGAFHCVPIRVEPTP